jgi:hypothetical protein
MTEEELIKTLDLHKTWISDCTQGMRANLSRLDLLGVDLSFSELKYAKLVTTNLRCADLYNTDLVCADLSTANLNGAVLDYADLTNANLANANLTNANLIGANLDKTNLIGANLMDARLDDAKGSLIEYRKGKILTEDIIGYKKCKDGVIVTLRIPRGAIVFSINGYKCRTNKAKVVAIDGATRAISRYKYMSYYVGDEFTIYNFDCEYNVECGTGIHFFMNREDAIAYY